MAARIKRGDLVVVISGEDKGKTGKVIRVEPPVGIGKKRHAGRVYVEGVNLQFKHMKRTQQNPKGGRVQREGPLPISKVMLWSEQEKKPQRFRVEVRDGKRVRVGARDGAVYA
jgi:large subunit ribosomal protein L24